MGNRESCLNSIYVGLIERTPRALILENVVRDAMHTVMIVDDEPQILELLSRFFREEGLHVLDCSGVTEALRQLQDICFDLLVIDCDMPDGSGSTVINAANEWCPGSECVLITGDVTQIPSNVRRAAVQVFEKPELIAPLRIWLRSRLLDARPQVHVSTEKVAADPEK